MQLENCKINFILRNNNHFFFFFRPDYAKNLHANDDEDEDEQEQEQIKASSGNEISKTKK